MENEITSNLISKSDIGVLNTKIDTIFEKLDNPYNKSSNKNRLKNKKSTQDPKKIDDKPAPPQNNNNPLKPDKPNPTLESNPLEKPGNLAIPKEDYNKMLDDLKKIELEKQKQFESTK